MNTIKIDWAIYDNNNVKERLRATFPGCRIVDSDDRLPLFVSSSAIEGRVWIRANPSVVGSHQVDEVFEAGRLLQ